jgi:hypothetical protein
MEKGLQVLSMKHASTLRWIVKVALPLGVPLGASVLSSCTTLGPMPASTGIAAVPAGRPAGELGIGIVPGYYLSSGVRQSPSGAGITQGSLLLEPDRLIHLPGLVVGARHLGDSDTPGYFEPLAGYRSFIDDHERIAAIGVAYLTHATGSQDGASYSMTRGGIEVGFDARATPRNRGIEIHANVSAALTGLSAHGQYCLDAAQQYGDTCGTPPLRLTPVSGSGLYPSATAGLSLDFARHLAVFFHGGRLGLAVAGGTMPTAIGGKQASAHWYGSAGLSLMLGFGANR